MEPRERETRETMTTLPTLTGTDADVTRAADLRSRAHAAWTEARRTVDAQMARAATLPEAQRVRAAVVAERAAVVDGAFSHGRSARLWLDSRARCRASEWLQMLATGSEWDLAGLRALASEPVPVPARVYEASDEQPDGTVDRYYTTDEPDLLHAGACSRYQGQVWRADLTVSPPAMTEREVLDTSLWATEADAWVWCAEEIERRPGLDPSVTRVR